MIWINALIQYCGSELVVFLLPKESSWWRHFFFQARAKTSSSKEKAYTWKHLKWVEVVRVYFCWSHGLIVSVVCAPHLRRFHVGPVLWLADKRPHTDNICPSGLMFYAWGREFLKRGKKKRKRGRFHSEKVQKHEEFHEMSPQVDGKTNDTQAARMLLSLWSMGAKISCCHQSLHICCKEVYLNINNEWRKWHLDLGQLKWLEEPLKTTGHLLDEIISCNMYNTSINQSTQCMER